VLVSRRFLFVRLFPFLQIPNLKTAAAANEHDLALQANFFAKILRQNEAALFVDGAMLRAGVELTKKNAPIARGNIRIGFGGGAHARKFFRRHDQKKLVSRFRKNDEFLGVTTSPARGNGESILFVDGVTKLAGVETLVRLLHLRVEKCSILTHFSPLLTTFRARRQQKLMPSLPEAAGLKSELPMPLSLFLCVLILIAFAFRVDAQPIAPNSNDTIRVTVTVNADGSRTTYQYDNAKHEAIATTADPDGKARGKVVYRIDDAGRFASGVVFGPDDKFLFKTIYKYDAAGRLEQESRLAKDDTLINKITYKYDAAGKQIGYSMFDASGKLISGSSSPAASAPPKSRNPHGR
jgi:hypothetical protein